MSELGLRTFGATTLSSKDANVVKRVKNDDSDSSNADTSSESQEDSDKLQRMTQALQTIIEVPTQ